MEYLLSSLEGSETNGKVEFHQLQDGSRKVLSRGIKSGDEILKIPLDLTLYSNTPHLTEEEEYILSNNGKYDYGISTFKLMLHLIDLLEIVGSQKYYYLMSLPKSFNLPIEWGEDKLGFIKGTDLYKITLEKKKWLENALVIANSKKIPLKIYSRKDMIWAYSVISSRSFPKGPGEICLWPILDYLDHHPEAKIEWVISDTDITFKAMQDIECGSIVYNNYGPKGNENLLNNYGFVLEDNPNDYVKVTLNSKNDHLHDEKKNLVEEDKWLLFKDDDLPSGMIRLCRILLCNGLEWQESDKNYDREISLRNEIATFVSLVQLLEGKLEPYLQSQESLLAYKEKDLSIYISSHINILMHHIQLCKQRLDHVLVRADLFSLHHANLDQVFLNTCRKMEIDEDTLLCLCLIHEKENLGIFSSRLSNLKALVTDDQEEEDHFINFVLPYFESDYINLNNLKWASAILTYYGGCDLEHGFGVWLPVA